MKNKKERHANKISENELSILDEIEASMVNIIDNYNQLLTLNKYMMDCIK